MTKGPKPILELADFRPKTLEQAVMLERALIEVGERRTIAASLVMSLVRGPEALPSATKTSYRHTLAKLEVPPWQRTKATVGTRSKGA